MPGHEEAYREYKAQAKWADDQARAELALLREERGGLIKGAAMEALTAHWKVMGSYDGKATHVCDTEGRTVAVVYAGEAVAASMVESHNLLLGPLPEMFAVPRSGHWEKVRNDFLKDHPSCAACGSTVNLQIHHKKPFHLHPEDELNPANLITLCMEPGKMHHFVMGHFSNWHLFNPEIQYDANRMLRMIGESEPLGESI